MITTRIAMAVALASLATGAPVRADDAALAVRWLGVAGFSFESGGHVLLHDPFLSRPGLWSALVYRYEPDAALLGRLLGPGSPAPELARARLVLIGHSHYDHVADAPWIAARTGATLAGSLTSVSIARAYGLDAERTNQIDPGARFDDGPFTVRVVESRHAPVLFGRVPLEGELTEPPDGPIRVLSMPLGDARGYLVTHRPSGLRVYVLSSAAVYRPALEALREEGVRVDLLLAAVQGRDEGFARALVETLRPRIVVPHHADDIFRSLDHPDAAAPSDPEDVDAFEAELRSAASEAGHSLAVRRLGLWERMTLSAD